MRWVWRFFPKRRAEDALDKELLFHLERQIDDYLRAGMPVDEARRRARLEFGGLERVKEEVRDVRWQTHLDNLLRDFRHAFRSLKKDKKFAAIAIFTLALGLGASTVVFSVVYNAIFEAFPYKDYQRWVVFGIHNLANAGGWKSRNYFFPEEVRAFREQNHVFDDLIAYENLRLRFDDGKSVHFWPLGATVSGNTFAYLGVAPYIGRGISPDDAKPGAPLVVVLNYKFWQSGFGGDLNVLGRAFLLDGRPTTLVGIMPPNFDAFHASYWVPDHLDKDGPALNGGAAIIGRLRPGVGLQAAGAELDAIAHRLQKENPQGIFPEKFLIVPERMLDSAIGDFRKTLYALLGAVFLLLLIACSNVANLLLARATAREREMAMRAAMGASRARLVRQLLVESFLLAVAASMAGCTLAYFGLKIIVSLIPAGTLPDETVIHMNVPVLFLSLGATVFTTILCGLAPALHVGRGDLQPRLAGSGKGTGGSPRHGKLRGSLVIGQVALSILLLIGAGLLVRSFLALTHVDLGFDPQNVFYFRLDPTMYAQYADDEERKARQNALTRRLLERLSVLPGVVSAGESIQEPPLKYDWSDTILPGKPHADRWETRYEICSEGYFQTLGLPLIRGRFFSEDDVDAGRFLMVVNQAFARQYFSGENPIGKKVKLDVLDRPFLDGPRNTYFEVVGVVADYKTRGPDSWQTFPEVFIPYSVQAFSWRTFLARTSLDANSFLKGLAQEVRALDPGVGIAESGTLEGALHEFYRGPQFELVTLGAFASIGLALAAIGIFSVMAYTVSLRTHEIGIRMALGAQQKNVLRLVLLTGFRLVAAGVVLGVGASYALGRYLAGQVSSVPSTDPLTFAAVAGIVVSVGLTACLLPAFRAAQLDPLVALRHE
jgi:putative ABC transport system permease protein